MQLRTLFAGLPIARVDDAAGAVTVSGITDDSRAVEPGDLLICRGPVNERAVGYIKQALERGAAAVLSEPIAEGQMPGSSIGVPHLVAKPDVLIDQRLAGQIAERFFEYPAKKLTLVGITGTNGKTTTATITQHLLRVAGQACGLLGTVHVDTGDASGPRPAELTTPGAIELSRLLAEMVANGCNSAVMEVSSHALHQGRADHLRFAAAAFTNLTQDHLDYHGTMGHYADAKAMLFEALDADATAVLNGDDPAAERMVRGCRANVLLTHTTSDRSSRDDACSAKHGDAYALATELTASQTRARFVGPWGDVEASLPLVGPHNLANAIQAAALANAVTGIAGDAMRTALEACPPVPGRLEPVGPDWPEGGTGMDAHPAVLVDYAHTPDALVNVASALRPLTPQGGRLIIVFGCGGDRDRAKRPLMARAARQFADLVVLTSDNPRTEDPQQILDDAAGGFAATEAAQSAAPQPETHIEISRTKAIALAIGLARPGDTVLIAGKGHEDYQILGTEKTHFDDREHAAAALREKHPPACPA